MKNLNIGILFLAVLFLTECVVADENFKSFTEHQFDSVLNMNYFKTESNFAKDGSQQSLPSGYSLQVTDLFIQGRYVLIEDLGLYGGMNIGSSESTDLLATRRNSTLNYVHLGADYLFYQSHLMSIYADFSYHQALEKIATDTDSSLNSDGASEVHAKVTTLFDFNYIQPYASVGVNYRLEGLSTLLTYSVGAQSSFSKLVLGAALNGFVSVIDDSKTNTPADRELITNRVSATSKKFYSINPNLLDSDLYLKYIFNPSFTLQANGGYGLVGSNTALGYHVGLGMTWAFGGGESTAQENYSAPTTYRSQPNLPPVNPQKQTKKQHVTKPVKKFQEDTNDGVNQDYFTPVEPSQEDYIDQSDEGLNKAEEEDFKVVPKKAAPPANDNEYKIKLKKTKKKKQPVTDN